MDKLMECGKLDHLKNGPIYWVDSSDCDPCMGEEDMLLNVEAPPSPVAGRNVHLYKYFTPSARAKSALNAQASYNR